jgi:hypothetical protein
MARPISPFLAEYRAGVWGIAVAFEGFLGPRWVSAAEPTKRLKSGVLSPCLLRVYSSHCAPDPPGSLAGVSP